RRVTTHSSSPSDFPVAPVTAPPETHRRAAILIRPREAFFFRRVSPRSLDHHPSSSSSPTNSSPVHSSGLDAPSQAHSGSSTRVVSPRLGYALEIHQRDHCIDLHILLDHLARDRYRHSYSYETSMEEDTDIDTTEIEDGRELYIVDGDDVRDRIKVDPRDDREEFEASAGDTVVLGIDPRLVPMVDEEIVEPVEGDSSSLSGTRDGTVKSVKDIPVDLDGAIRDFYHHMSELRVDRISIRSLRSENLKVYALLCIKRDRVDSLRLHMSCSQEEFWLICDDRNDLRRKLRRTMINTRFGMMTVTIEKMINRRVAEALKPLEINKNLGPENGNGNGNGGNGNGQDGNRNGDGRGDRPVARECTYQDFMKCQPVNFKGTKGVVGLIRWCEKIKIVFHISNCPERYQVKYATCTLLNGALT
nr:hypothetical protein [Tanacetum cinerariifolium]